MKKLLGLVLIWIVLNVAFTILFVWMAEYCKSEPHLGMIATGSLLFSSAFVIMIGSVIDLKQ